MKLILILLAIGAHHLIPGLVERRRYRWLRASERQLAQRWSGLSHLLGGLGAVLLLGLPVLAVLYVEHYLLEISDVLGALFALAVLLYSLGPTDLSKELEDYINAHTVADKEAAALICTDLGVSEDYHGTPAEPLALGRAVLVFANERLFGPLFWFAIAGAGAAFVYRIAHQLASSEEAHSVRFRHFAWWFRDLVDWLPARVLAFGYALGGSFGHAMDRWVFFETLGLSDSRRALADSGMGALMHDEELIARAAEHREVEIAQSVKTLIGRTLVIALVVLAVTTLGGWTQ